MKNARSDTDILAMNYLKAILKRIKPDNLCAILQINKETLFKICKCEATTSTLYFDKIQRFYNEFINNRKL